jgi:hypothetical protein
MVGEKGNVSADLASAVVGAPSVADRVVATGSDLAGKVVEKGIDVGIDVGVDHTRDRLADRIDGEEDPPAAGPGPVSA